ncbi:unnamed protein product [Sphenostylis stenocarpa]|uniref:Uncharacterized protein n=1 Tax=Sphenostylis stenocarpa TaxID=92480 RepID=A0AA86SEI3_9FABA|nr:unnamed protein product [Sphenostylis stenocarpa]
METEEEERRGREEEEEVKGIECGVIPTELKFIESLELEMSEKWRKSEGLEFGFSNNKAEDSVSLLGKSFEQLKNRMKFETCKAED